MRCGLVCTAPVGGSEELAELLLVGRCLGVVGDCGDQWFGSGGGWTVADLAVA
jgi:hypothetical protein